MECQRHEFQVLGSQKAPSSNLTLEGFAENNKTFLFLELFLVFKRAVILVYKENCKLKKKQVRTMTFNSHVRAFSQLSCAVRKSLLRILASLSNRTQRHLSYSLTLYYKALTKK